ncbi:hypothetical protein MC885_017248 [Smutsia gigantea]|nr:hypothetical protein MC885_017248 [Smutsia gigantea]
MEFDLAAAVDSTSKKPQEAGQVRDPKHSPPKVPGQSEARAANNPKDHGRSSDSSSSSSSSSDSDMEAKHESTPGKVKTPKVKKEKKEGKNKEKKEGKKGKPH